MYSGDAKLSSNLPDSEGGTRNSIPIYRVQRGNESQFTGFSVPPPAGKLEVRSGQLKLNDPPFGQNLAENKGGSFRCGRCPFLDLASESDLEPIITSFTGLSTPRQLSDTNLRSPKIRAPENKGGGSFSFNCPDRTAPLCFKIFFPAKAPP